VLKKGGLYILSDTGVGGLGGWIDNNILFRLSNSGDCHTTNRRGIAEMIKMAQQKNIPGAEFVNGTADELPFPDESFDIVTCSQSFHHYPYPEKAMSEAFRVLKKGGILLAGLDNGVNYIFDIETESVLTYKLPFNPLRDEAMYKLSVENDWGIQFSHTIEEQIGGQLEAGLVLTHIYGDTNGEGRLHEMNIECYYATRAVKM
jgi:SAM-dependent methyltransferase